MGFYQADQQCWKLLKILDLWSEALDNGDSIEVIYLDFRKAFDLVPHGRLLKKIEYYGIQDPFKSWLEDFLKDRKLFVAFGDEKSESVEVTSGIPQASVLGTLMFVLYINDLPDCLENTVYMFADDSKLFQIA